MKALMAVTGLILIGFLLMHMFGNLKVFLGADDFNHYAHWLHGETPDGGIMAPIMPAGSFIWVFRAVLLASVVLHMISAITLWRRSHIAAGPSYQKTKRLQQTYSARTMRYGGVILALFVIFHLLQFTVRAVRTGFGAEATPYDMVIGTFQQPWLVILYFVCMVAVCMHVRHGFWSAFTTLGANTSANARVALNVLAYIVASALFLGFMVMPFAVLFGLGK